MIDVWALNRMSLIKRNDLTAAAAPRRSSVRKVPAEEPVGVPIKSRSGSSSRLPKSRSTVRPRCRVGRVSG